MTGNTAQFLGLLMRQLTGVQGSIAHINENLGKMALLAGGAVAAFAGFEGLKGIWHVVEASQKLNDELLRTRQLGGEFASTIGASRAAAFRTSAEVPTFAPSELVRMQRELGSQMQNPQAAIDVLPLAAKVAATVSHYTGEDQETIIKNLVKIVDLRAKLFSMDASGKEFIDPSKLVPELEAAAKGLILGGNYLKSRDLLQMARQAGVPVKTMSQEAFYAAMVEMAVSQGAQRAGTAASSMFSQMVGGVMPQRVAKEMTTMGLMSKDEWKAARGGSVILEGSATQRFQDAMKDPIAFITGPLNDLLTRKGMTFDQKIMEVYRLFGRETTRRFVAEALSSDPQFERARAMAGNIPSVEDQWKFLQNESLNMNIKAFSTAWTGFMEALGSAGIPSAISILQSLTDGLHSLTSLVNENHDAARYIMELAAALSALLLVGGTLTVLTIALRGLVIPLRGIAAIAGLATMGANLTGIGAGLAAIAGVIARFSGPLGFLLGMKPSATQSPEADRAPYGGKSLSERFPGLVVPPGTPLGPTMAPGPVGPGVPGSSYNPATQQWESGPSRGSLSPISRAEAAPVTANIPPEQTQSMVAGFAAAVRAAVAGMTISLDGKKVGEIVSGHQADQASRPLSGSSQPDLRMTPLNAGLPAGWVAAP